MGMDLQKMKASHMDMATAILMEMATATSTDMGTQTHMDTATRHSRNNRYDGNVRGDVAQ
jgi:hypothetical protein